MQILDIINELEKWANPKFLITGDSSGLQVGDFSKNVRKILVCLTLTEKILKTAIQKNADLIVAHHPLITEPLKQINFFNLQGKLLELLIKNDIAFYCAHTNLDVAPFGVSDVLADKIGIADKSREVLLPVYYEKLFKLSVFVPEKFSEKVFTAITNSGAGSLGNYDSCVFFSAGEGTFRPLSGSRPFIGERGKVSRVKEIKIETIVSEFKLQAVLKAMFASHPYEEVAYDIFPLENHGKIYGLGRVGKLKKAISLSAYLNQLKKEFKNLKIHLPPFKNKNFEIKNVAVSPGSGNRVVSEVINKKANVFVTGEIRYHELLQLLFKKIIVIELGHYDSEKIIVPFLAKYLKEKTKLSIIT